MSHPRPVPGDDRVAYQSMNGLGCRPDRSRHQLPRWGRWSAYGAVLAASPTIIWRVVLATGISTPGTPTGWRRAQEIPGSGVTYLITLSVMQMIAALLILVLVVPGADYFPGTAPRRRLPAGFVVGTSGLGLTLLTAVCALSVANWSKVDPFRLSNGDPSAWAYLGWACYGVALLWPPLLLATTIAYARSRQHPPPKANID